MEIKKMTLKELIEFVSNPKVIDGEGEIIDDRYWEAMDAIKEELSIADKEETQNDIEGIKTLIKRHKHLEGKIVAEI